MKLAKKPDSWYIECDCQRCWRTYNLCTICDKSFPIEMINKRNQLNEFYEKYSLFESKPLVINAQPLRINSPRNSTVE